LKRLLRLISYVRPYWLQAISSVILMAAVGLLDAFRILLVGPIFDRVLNPDAPDRPIPLFGPRFHISLQQIVPAHFHNEWAIVAFALVGSTLLKGIFDYCGTYLVNYAGFGMITDLRDDLYNAILRRSVSFFQQHATGTIVSTLINDIERVQFAMSSVLAEFLQQFFTLIFTACVVVALGGKLAWVLLLFVPVVLASARRIGRDRFGRQRAGARISWRKSRTFCTRPLPETASSRPSIWSFGR
jgi:subfamily B ATP-binding cassette protein MsbA